jgi:hypothetical protein
MFSIRRGVVIEVLTNALNAGRPPPSKEPPPGVSGSMYPPAPFLIRRAWLPHSPNVGGEAFCELRLYGVLGSSRFAGVVFLSQEGGMGVARLKDSPSS